jgi:benzoate membrane transport protein
MVLEPPERPLPSWRDLVASLDRHTVTNATVAWLYAITGPLAILLAVGSQVGFTHDQIAAWIFGGYAIGGFYSVLMSWMYRQPNGVAWSIPGAILIGPALDHLSFAEIVGAGIAAGLLIAVLGVTGWVRKVMSFCPLPVVMGMVCGVFLPFGLNIITGFEDDPWIALPILVAFITSSAAPTIERVLPPILAALAAGIVAVIVTGHGVPTAPVRFGLAYPNILLPEFSLRALFELVLPLAVTVIGIHNPQGFAMLEASNYRPPVNALTLACGGGSILSALLGSVPICVAGPSNAVMCSSGRGGHRFVAGIVYGLLFLAFGILAPGRKAWFLTYEARFERETDSPLEGGVSCELVSEIPKFPASWENTGNFIDSGPRRRVNGGQKGHQISILRANSLRMQTGNFFGLTGN